MKLPKITAGEWRKWRNTNKGWSVICTQGKSIATEVNNIHDAKLISAAPHILHALVLEYMHLVGVVFEPQGVEHQIKLRQQRMEYIKSVLEKAGVEL